MTEVTAVTIAYGEQPLLKQCIDQLLGSLGVEVDVVVVDNGAPPGTLEAIESRARVRVVHTDRNLGFGGGCNAAMASGGAPVVAFVNPDALVEPEALARLAAVVADESVGIATASVRLLEDPDVVNSAGGAIHFVGLGWADRFGSRGSDVAVARDVAAASGAAMAMRRDVFESLGGFTEELFLYHEDAELSFRAWLAGYRVVFVPDAVVLHDYEFSRNPGKLYLLERNRLVLLATCYAARTLTLLLPALVAYEVGIVLVAAAQGWLPEKVRGWRWLVSNRAWVATRRRDVQARRVSRDADVAHLFASSFEHAPIGLPRGLGPANAALSLYWSIVKRFL